MGTDTVLGGGGGANRGTGTAFGRGGRIFDMPDPTKRRSDVRGWLWRPDMGTGTEFGRLDS